jgi:hypothetical protein
MTHIIRWQTARRAAEQNGKKPAIRQAFPAISAGAQSLVGSRLTRTKKVKASA